MEANPDLPQSKHFTVERLADGVYAAIAIEGTGSMGNAGLVDLGDRTLVFDTMWTPQAARDLKHAAERLTGRPVAYVVNGHFHGDHVLGNLVFAQEAEIIATTRTRELIAERTAPQVDAHRAKPEGGEAYLRSLEDQVEREPNQDTRRQLALTLAGMREYIAALPELDVVLPNVTFESRMRLHGSRRTVELITYGGGHTASDAFLFLPEDGILFAGDLVVVDNHPMLLHGDVVAWPQILTRMERLDFATLVPGHGPISGREALPLVRQYIADLLRLATGLFRQGYSAEDAATAALPEQYAGFGAPEVFPRNMRFLCEFVASRQAAVEEAS